MSCSHIEKRSNILYGYWYIYYRAFCKLPRACDWAVPPQDISRDKWTALSRLYEHPNDIDLFVGGLAETPVSGGVTGRTFNCIKGKQFEALKWGDRFFYTHRGSPGSLTTAQYNEIQVYDIRDITCSSIQLGQFVTNTVKHFVRYTHYTYLSGLTIP